MSAESVIQADLSAIPAPATRRGLKVLASGVDSLYASVPGQLIDGVTQALAATKELGDADGTVLNLREEDGHFLLRRHGWRGYPFWLSSPRFELFVGAAAPFPPVYVALHSTYIHTLGVEEAAEDVRRQLGQLIRGEVHLIPSRIDVYADVQRWQPRVSDFDRFICRGVRRRLYEQPRELHGSGRQLSGFVFGKGDVVARVYNKSLEMKVRGSTWQELIWQDRDANEPVWRVEFQFRRRGLTTFGFRSMEQALRGRQDLWEYGTRWLSLRKRASDPRPRRWPEAPAWVALRNAQLGSPRSGLVRERIRSADERRLVSGFVGYVSSLAAMSGHENVDGAVRHALPLAERYLRERGTEFADIVGRKRERRRAAP